jgi:hypothetical protein
VSTTICSAPGPGAVLIGRTWRYPQSEAMRVLVVEDEHVRDLADDGLSNVIDQ